MLKDTQTIRRLLSTNFLSVAILWGWRLKGETLQTKTREAISTQSCITHRNHPKVAFHIETGHLIINTNQVTGF